MTDLLEWTAWTYKEVPGGLVPEDAELLDGKWYLRGQDGYLYRCHPIPTSLRWSGQNWVGGLG